MSTKQRLVELLSELVAVPTAYPPGETTALCAMLAPRLEAMGYRVGIHSERPGLDNLVATIGVGEPHLVFNAHADTVGEGEASSWQTDPFTLTAKGDRLYGLGSSNCKGSMAVHLWLAEEIVRRGGPAKGSISFTFVTDEESLGPHGMAFLRESGAIKPTYLFLGAPTSNALITSERGVMWVGIETFGKAAHAGAPDTGDNAILRMLRIVAALEKDLFPTILARKDGALQSTYNIGKLHGGHNTNVVPSRCRLEIDRRLLPSETVEQAYAEIVEALERSGEPAQSWRAEFMRGTNGFSSARNGALVKALSEAVISVTASDDVPFLDAVGASDGRWFADDGIEIVNFGPGGGSEGHAADEFVLASELEQSAAIHVDFVGRLIGFAGRG